MILDADTYDLRVYLEIVATGPWSLEAAREIVLHVRDEAIRTGRNRVLLDARLVRGDPGDFGRFAVGKHFADIWGSRIAVAIIYPVPMINRLAETAAVNRGARVVVVGTIEEAALWLAQVRLPSGDALHGEGIRT